MNLVAQAMTQVYLRQLKSTFEELINAIYGSKSSRRDQGFSRNDLELDYVFCKKKFQIF